MITLSNLRKIALPIVGTAAIAVFATGTVLAWPTRGPEIDCTHVHWEMQNDTRVNQTFTGTISGPIGFSTTQTVKPNEWGVLDKTYNLTGNNQVSASISMGGDTRNTSKTVNCVQPSPTPTPSATPTPSPSATPSPTPSATPSPTPTPSASPVATPTPTPTPSPCTENCGITINNNNNNTNNNTNINNVNASSTSAASNPKTTPATGPGEVAMATMAGIGPIGFALSKFKKGQLFKDEQEIEEFASSVFKNRQTDLS